MGIYYISVFLNLYTFISAIFKAFPAQFLMFTILSWKKKKSEFIHKGKKSKSGVRNEVRKYCNSIASGLLFCSFGDFFLHLCIGGEKTYTNLILFMLGLGSFLVGHLWFLGAFMFRILDLRKFTKVRVSGPALIFGGYALLMLSILLPHIPHITIKIGVVAYSSAISLMGICSMVLS